MDLSSERSKKADNADNAPVPSDLWDQHLILSFDANRGIINLSNCLRRLALSWCRRNLFHSLRTCLRSHYRSEYNNLLDKKWWTLTEGGDFRKSLEVGRDVLERACDST